MSFYLIWWMSSPFSEIGLVFPYFILLPHILNGEIHILACLTCFNFFLENFYRLD